MLPAFLFGSRLILGIIKMIGAIDGQAFFGLFAEAFGFQLSNLRLVLIEFGLQFCVPSNRAGMHAFPIAHITTQLGVLASQFEDFLLQLLDKSRQRPQLFGNRNLFHKRSTHNAPK